MQYKQLNSNRLEYSSVISDKNNGYQEAGNKLACIGGSSEIDAFLYGLPGGLLIAGLVLICFTMFGNALSGRRGRENVASMSSNTRIDKKYIIGKKHKRGPPPSQELRPLDVSQLAMSDNAPDDIKAMNAAKLINIRRPPNR